MTKTRNLNDEFQLLIGDNGHERATWHTRGDIVRAGSSQAVVTLFGEGPTQDAAEDDVWAQAQNWLLRRGRAR